MNTAKFSIAEDTNTSTSPGVSPDGNTTCVLSSGSGLVAHPVPGTFSILKSSLVIPNSTFAASPAKSSSDLFWAFHPNFVTVPSLPLRLRTPSGTAVAALAAGRCRFANRSASATFSTRPNPKVGVGIRKIALLLLNCVGTSG